MSDVRDNEAKQQFELIEALVLRGDATGLLTRSGAGDTAMAVVLAFRPQGLFPAR